ncbi:MAG: hypothetical protein LBE48_04585 [Methanomassiliicoccaceae archaeon]|jgi:hypothetical protein|nr:hypothetical protein [Methanomassiliicoccaceae archaeon]
MAKDGNKPGLLHSFLGGLIFTIVLVVIVPILIAWLVEPIVVDIIGDTQIAGLIDTASLVTVVMLIILILFLILLGGGKIFKKYGIIGVIGLIIAYWLLGNVWNAVIPVIIIMLLVVFSYLKGDKKK